MKIIIWGYPYGSDTLSYVWNGFFKAFQQLGYSVIWLPDQSKSAESSLLDNSVVLCEEYQTKHLPIKESSTYIVHTCIKPEKYLGKCQRLIDLRYNEDYQDHATNYKYYLDRYRCDKVGPLAYYQKATDYDRLYLSWATDLLPQEFNFADARHPREPISYFIGTRHSDRYQNATAMNEWQACCIQKGIEFRHIDPWINPVSDEMNRKIIKQCYLAPDLRGPSNIKTGYIPCRIFKNISYGQIGLTNSRAIYSALEDMVIYHPEIPKLFALGEEYKDDYKRIIDLMKLVQEKHTYINRAQAILDIL